MIEKGKFEAGAIIKGSFDRKMYIIKEITIGGAKIQELQTGAEITVGISALKLFFQ